MPTSTPSRRDILVSTLQPITGRLRALWKRPKLMAALVGTLILGALIGSLLTPPAGSADPAHSVLVVTQAVNGGDQITDARLEIRRVTDTPDAAIPATRRDAIATQVASLILTPGHVLTHQDITKPLGRTALATLRVASNHVPAELRVRRVIRITGPTHTSTAIVAAIRTPAAGITVVDVAAFNDDILTMTTTIPHDEISISATGGE